MQFEGLVTPKHVLVYYDDKYSEYANVENGEIGAFKPITQDFLQKISIQTKIGQTLCGVTPKNLVGYIPIVNSYRIVFTTPEQTKTIHHTSGELKINFPKMIWFYDKNKDHLELFKYDTLAKNAIMIPINFSNVNSGTVCIGTCPRPKSQTFKEVIKETQEMFFDGKFNHDQIKITYSESKENLWKTVLKFTSTY